MIAPMLAQRSARTVRPVAGKPAAEPAGDDDAGKQDREPRQPRDLGPVRGDEGKERGRDQEAADDGDDDGDVDAGRSGGSALRMAAEAAGASRHRLPIA